MRGLWVLGKLNEFIRHHACLLKKQVSVSGRGFKYYHDFFAKKDVVCTLGILENSIGTIFFVFKVGLAID